MRGPPTGPYPAAPQRNLGKRDTKMTRGDAHSRSPLREQPLSTRRAEGRAPAKTVLTSSSALRNSCAPLRSCPPSLPSWPSSSRSPTVDRFAVTLELGRRCPPQRPRATAPQRRPLLPWHPPSASCWLYGAIPRRRRVAPPRRWPAGAARTLPRARRSRRGREKVQANFLEPCA